jgi:hypothetical protein
MRLYGVFVRYLGDLGLHLSYKGACASNLGSLVEVDYRNVQWNLG